MYRPSASVVVNTFNRATYLADALRGLAQLDYDNFEIIVVNGPSTDGTASLLGSWADRAKVLSCGVANLAVSRNLGIAAAAGEIVAFIDDDAVPHPQWLSHLACKYADPRVGGVGGFTVDNSGTRFQCRKTLCDRYGNPYHVPAVFDERPFNRPGTPAYPSLLGTNSSFRRDVLEEVGGFDETFAYYLDETDVCLRIVDAGYMIMYEASALVFHQFASSGLRTATRVARSVYPSAVSKAYFVMRHGAMESVEDAGRHLNAYRDEILKANQWLADDGVISADHRHSLDQDLLVGIQEGQAKAYARRSSATGDLAPPTGPPGFRRYQAADRLRVALVSQDYPPFGEAGIARWTSMVATGLADRGHAVHVVTRAVGEPFTRFQDGVWVHAVSDDPVLGQKVASQHGIPLNLAARAASVRQTVAFIKSFGLDVLSFPVWDVEGIACLDDPDIAVFMSLHTTYGLAKPHKKEWRMRPLYEHFAVDPVIAAEGRLLRSVPRILANSQAIVADIAASTGVDFGDRVILCPHGTTDPLAGHPARSSARQKRSRPVKLLYAGRFEIRKGFDIAAKVFERVLSSNRDVHIDIVGEELTHDTRAWLRSLGAGRLLESERVHFGGLVDRNALEDRFSEADIVVMPSRYESFGLVAIEAMAGGAVVLALDVGGLAEVVTDGVSGMLVPMDGREVDTLVDKVSALIDDPPLRTRLGQGARQSFQDVFPVDKMIDRLESAFAQVSRKLPHDN